MTQEVVFGVLCFLVRISSHLETSQGPGVNKFGPESPKVRGEQVRTRNVPRSWVNKFGPSRLLATLCMSKLSTIASMKVAPRKAQLSRLLSVPGKRRVSASQNFTGLEPRANRNDCFLVVGSKFCRVVAV